MSILKKSFLLATLIVFSSFCLFSLPSKAEAAITVLHEFAGGSDDGKLPIRSLVSSGNKLYGMTYQGGDSDEGIIFSIDSDGNNFDILHEFDSLVDGGNPTGSLVASGNKLYGMAGVGGASGLGIIFSIDMDGNNFDVLHEFAGGEDDGSSPYDSLIISDNKLYGMTELGGDFEYGVVFSIDTDGNNFNILHEFDGTDGSNPTGSLVLSGNKLYGMTDFGGTSDDFGVVFSIDTDGNNFDVLHEFAGSGDDGQNPQGSLTYSDSTLYGMTYQGGDSDKGIIFSIDPDGNNFDVLHEFAGGSDDGSNPYDSLIISDNKLYGMTDFGGTYNRGVVFSIDPDGNNFDILHGFSNNDGKNPMGSPIISNNTLYGMTYLGGEIIKGGSTIWGIIFSLSLGNSTSENTEEEEEEEAKIASWKAYKYSDPNGNCIQKLKIIITGKHFDKKAEVKIGNKKASSVKVNSGKKLTAKFCLDKLLDIKTDLKRKITVTNPDADIATAKKKINLSNIDINK